MIAAVSVFGLAPVELAVVAAGVAYVVSLAKDWRPIRTLRAENRELRTLCEAGEKKIAALEAEVRTLQKATDLTSLVMEHKKIAEALERVVAKLDSLDGAVHANTAAIELVASGSALRQTIEDMNPSEGGAS